MSNTEQTPSLTELGYTPHQIAMLEKVLSGPWSVMAADSGDLERSDDKTKPTEFQLEQAPNARSGALSASALEQLAARFDRKA